MFCHKLDMGALCRYFVPMFKSFAEIDAFEKLPETVQFIRLYDYFSRKARRPVWKKALCSIFGGQRKFIDVDLQARFKKLLMKQGEQRTQRLNAPGDDARDVIMDVLQPRPRKWVNCREIKSVQAGAPPTPAAPGA